MRIFDWSDGSSAKIDPVVAKKRLLRRALFALAIVFSAVSIGVLSVVTDREQHSSTQAEMQRIANETALSAAERLIGEGELGNDPQLARATATARSVANSYLFRNYLSFDEELDTDAGSDDSAAHVEIGQYVTSALRGPQLDIGNPAGFNAVHVALERSRSATGGFPFLVASYLGFASGSLEVKATAVIRANVRGFQVGSTGEYVPILPIALDETSWRKLVAGNSRDDWSWDERRRIASAGGDGIREVNLCPEGEGSTSDRGTLAFGGNNSRARLSQQIRHGIGEADLEKRNGLLTFDSTRTIVLPGEKGINPGIERPLELIKGQPRVLPIFRTVSARGSSAQYTIVKFVGVRVMHVSLGGHASSRKIMVQPAAIIVPTAIATDEPGLTDLIYTSAKLID